MVRTYACVRCVLRAQGRNGVVHTCAWLLQCLSQSEEEEEEEEEEENGSTYMKQSRAQATVNNVDACAPILLSSVDARHWAHHPSRDN
jgi:hypothetical protein